MEIKGLERLRDVAGLIDDDETADAVRTAADMIESDMNGLSHDLFGFIAKITGKSFDEGEVFTEWLDRWYTPNPVDKDGVPIRIGDTVYTPTLIPTKVIGFCDGS